MVRGVGGSRRLLIGMHSGNRIIYSAPTLSWMHINIHTASDVIYSKLQIVFFFFFWKGGTYHIWGISSSDCYTDNECDD